MSRTERKAEAAKKRQFQCEEWMGQVDKMVASGKTYPEIRNFLADEIDGCTRRNPQQKSEFDLAFKEFCALLATKYKITRTIPGKLTAEQILKWRELIPIMIPGAIFLKLSDEDVQAFYEKTQDQLSEDHLVLK